MIEPNNSKGQVQCKIIFTFSNLRLGINIYKNNDTIVIALIFNTVFIRFKFIKKTSYMMPMSILFEYLNGKGCQRIWIRRRNNRK